MAMPGRSPLSLHGGRALCTLAEHEAMGQACCEAGMLLRPGLPAARLDC
ncbi:MAG: hypothetical protein K6E40_10480 [Desulfovibrio sp.]|nr:hypothetical protein [Desulfovibrio sp.]